MEAMDQAPTVQFLEETIVGILSRSPVRSVLRFKCVSKFWMALISDPDFNRKHFNHTKNNKNSQKLLVNQERIDNDDTYDHSFYCSSLSSVQQVKDVEGFAFPSNFKVQSQNIYCCCDGLAIIGVGFYPDNENLTFMLWNPTTRESVVLPDPKCSHNTNSRIWGMGYDSIKDDYTILKIHRRTCIEILSLKGGNWRKIRTHPSDIHPWLSDMDSLAFVHGAFHWLGISDPQSTVVSFDTSNKVFGKIPLPELMISMFYLNECGVSVLDGMLCGYSSQVPRGKGTFHLWVMKNYGVKESWSHVVTVVYPGLYAPCYPIIPKYKFPDGEVLVSCRPWGRGSEFRTSQGPLEVWLDYDSVEEGFLYTESLISPRFYIQ